MSSDKLDRHQRNWPLIHSIVVLSAYALSLFGEDYIIWLSALGSMIYGLLVHREELIDLRLAIGLPNWVTLFRCFILPIIWFLEDPLLVFFGLSVFLSLDYLDGFLARRLKSQTRIGAYLDMETDALYVLIMTIFLVRTEGLSLLVIGVGLLRYVYEILTWVFKVNNVEPPRTKYGPFLAVILFISLLTPLIFPQDLAKILVYAGCTVVSASFAFSGYHQFFAQKRELDI